MRMRTDHVIQMLFLDIYSAKITIMKTHKKVLCNIFPPLYPRCPFDSICVEHIYTKYVSGVVGNGVERCSVKQCRGTSATITMIEKVKI